MKGRGNLTLTGQMGEVMQESAKAALSYVRSRAGSLKLDEDFYRKVDLHIHIPEGAVPKDGPSAGITIASALASALTQIPVHRDVAMTGEITLRGKVLPIGGLKEKVLAARRAGISTLIIPEENRKDLEEIQKEIPEEMEQLRFKLVKEMDEVLKSALTLPPEIKAQDLAEGLPPLEPPQPMLPPV
jgi:ATP-dependent Lon protease